MKSSNISGKKLANASSRRYLQSFSVLKKALQSNRLAHSILLYGEKLDLLEEVAFALSADLLGIDEKAWKRLIVHPDLFQLRPSNKMRQIGADETRMTIREIQHTSNRGGHKVVIIHEGDRMNLTAANVFLKTLEEPPLNTTLFLLTTQLHDILETIRSRCLHFYISEKKEYVDVNENRWTCRTNRMPQDSKAVDLERSRLVESPEPVRQNDPQDKNLRASAWEEWLKDYQGWLRKIIHKEVSQSDEIIFTLYGLVFRFKSILENLTHETWEGFQKRNQESKATQEEDIDKNEKTHGQVRFAENLENKSAEESIAIEIGIAKRIRRELFTEIEIETHAVAQSYLEEETWDRIGKLSRVIEELERYKNLLEVNLNEQVALEGFLLSALRIWTN